jgi:uncharacterized protein YceH (UPF0502 family)
MHKFDDLGIVLSTLQRLMRREPPLVKLLPKQPGTKEARYAHLLSGDVQTWTPEPPSESSPLTAPTDGDRITRIENELADLQKEIADLKQQFSSFRKQFE